MQDAVQVITAAANSGQGQSQAPALAASWCGRLLDQLEAPTIDNNAATGAPSTSSVGTLPEDAVVAEAEVSEAAVASGDDVSHFRNLLRRARSAKQTAELFTLTGQDMASSSQKIQAKKKAAKRARASLLQWLQQVAESAVLQ